jgi:O-antigen ligase
MGTALGVIGVMAIALLLADRLLPRWASAVTLVFATAGVAESVTRASWIGFIVGALLTIALCQRGRIRGLAVVGGFMAVAFFVLSSAFGSSALTTRLQTQDQIYNRIVPGAAAIRLIVANPLAGLGYDGYARNRESVLQSVGSISGAYGQNVLTPHNSLLRVGVESGLFGMIALIGIWASIALIFRKYLRNPRRRWLATMGIPALLVYITNAMANDMVVSRYINIIFCIAIGVLIGAGKQAPDAPAEDGATKVAPNGRAIMRSRIA